MGLRRKECNQCGVDRDTVVRADVQTQMDTEDAVKFGFKWLCAECFIRLLFRSFSVNPKLANVKLT